MNLADFFRQYTESYNRILSRQGLSAYCALLDLHLAALEGRDNVLDSGCGPGNLAVELLERGHEVYAVDQNNAALETLRTKAGKHAINLHTYGRDAHALPFESDFFDGVSSQLVLPFIERPVEYLQEHKRVLKDRGVLVVSGPDERARDEVHWMMKQWREEVINQGLWAKLGADWETMERYTRKNVRSNVRNWFSIDEIARILGEDIGMDIVKQTPNPLYYGKGYVVVAEKLQ